MKKIIIRLAVVIAIIALFMVFSNPSRDRHKEALTGLVDKLVIQKIGDKITPKKAFGKIVKDVAFGIGSSQLEQLIEDRLVVENYLLFSTANIQIEDRNIPIGIGVFGRVVLVL